MWSADKSRAAFAGETTPKEVGGPLLAHNVKPPPMRPHTATVRTIQFRISCLPLCISNTQCSLTACDACITAVLPLCGPCRRPTVAPSKTSSSEAAAMPRPTPLNRNSPLYARCLSSKGAVQSPILTVSGSRINGDMLAPRLTTVLWRSNACPKREGVIPEAVG